MIFFGANNITLGNLIKGNLLEEQGMAPQSVRGLKRTQPSKMETDTAQRSWMAGVDDSFINTDDKQHLQKFFWFLFFYPLTQDPKFRCPDGLQ